MALYILNRSRPHSYCIANCLHQVEALEATVGRKWLLKQLLSNQE